MLEVTRGRSGLRHPGKARERYAQDERTRGIGDGEPDVAHERAIELGYAGCAIGIARRIHLAQHEGMAADRSLAEDDEAARQAIGPFHRDRPPPNLPPPPPQLLCPPPHPLPALPTP